MTMHDDDNEENAHQETETSRNMTALVSGWGALKSSSRWWQAGNFRIQDPLPKMIAGGITHPSLQPNAMVQGQDYARRLATG